MATNVLHASLDSWEPILFTDEETGNSDMVRPQAVPLSSESMNDASPDSDMDIAADRDPRGSDEDSNIAGERDSGDSDKGIATERVLGGSDEDVNKAAERNSGESGGDVNIAAKRHFGESNEDGIHGRSNGASAHRDDDDVRFLAEDRHFRDEGAASLPATKKHGDFLYKEELSCSSSGRNAGTTSHKSSPVRKKSLSKIYRSRSISERVSEIVREQVADSDTSLEHTFSLGPRGANNEDVREGLRTGASAHETSMQMVLPRGSPTWATHHERAAPVTPGSQRSWQDTRRSKDSPHDIGVVKNAEFWKPLLSSDRVPMSSGDEFVLSGGKTGDVDTDADFNNVHPIASSMLRSMGPTGFDSEGFDGTYDGFVLAYNGQPGIFAPPTGKQYTVMLRLPSPQEFEYQASQIPDVRRVRKKDIERIFSTMHRHHQDLHLSRKDKYEILREMMQSRYGLKPRTTSELYKAYETLSGEYYASFDLPADIRLRNIDNLLLVQQARGQATQNGLKEGDIVVSINSQIVGNMDGRDAHDLLAYFATHSKKPAVLHWIRARFTPNPTFVSPKKVAKLDSVSTGSPRCRFVVPDPVSRSALSEHDESTEADPAQRLYRYNLRHRAMNNQAAMSGVVHKTADAKRLDHPTSPKTINQMAQVAHTFDSIVDKCVQSGKFSQEEVDCLENVAAKNMLIRLEDIREYSTRRDADGSTGDAHVHPRDLKKRSSRSQERSVAKLKERPLSPTERTSTPRRDGDDSWQHVVKLIKSRSNNNLSPRSKSPQASKASREKDSSMTSSVANRSPAHSRIRSPVHSSDLYPAAGSPSRSSSQRVADMASSMSKHSSLVSKTPVHQRGSPEIDFAALSPYHSSTRTRTPASRTNNEQPNISSPVSRINTMISADELSRPSHHRKSEKSCQMAPSLRGDELSAPRSPSRARSDSPARSMRRSDNSKKQGQERREETQEDGQVRGGRAPPTQFASRASTKYTRSYSGQYSDRVGDNSARSQGSHPRTRDQDFVRGEREPPLILPTMPTLDEKEASPAYRWSGSNAYGKDRTPLSRHPTPSAATRSSPPKTRAASISPSSQRKGETPSFFGSVMGSPTSPSLARSSFRGAGATPSVHSFRSGGSESKTWNSDGSKAEDGSMRAANPALLQARSREDYPASPRGYNGKDALCTRCHSSLKEDTEAPLVSGNISPSSVVTRKGGPHKFIQARDATTSPSASPSSHEQQSTDSRGLARTPDAATSSRASVFSRKQQSAKLHWPARTHDATTSPRTPAPSREQQAALLCRLARTHDATTSPRPSASSRDQQTDLRGLTRTRDATTSPCASVSSRQQQAAKSLSLSCMRDATTSPRAQQTMEPCRFTYAHEAPTSPRTQQAMEPCKFAYAQQASKASHTHDASKAPQAQQAMEPCRFADTHESPTAPRAQRTSAASQVTDRRDAATSPRTQQAVSPSMLTQMQESTTSTAAQRTAEPFRATYIHDAATSPGTQENLDLCKLTRAAGEAALKLARQKEGPYVCRHTYNSTIPLSEEKPRSFARVTNTQTHTFGQAMGNPREYTITQDTATSPRRIVEAASWQESEGNHLSHTTLPNMFPVYPTPFLNGGRPTPCPAPQADHAYSIMWCPWWKIAVPSGMQRNPDTRFDGRVDARSASKPTGANGRRASSPHAGSMRNQVASYRTPDTPLMRSPARPGQDSVFVNSTAIANRGIDDRASEHVRTSTIGEVSDRRERCVPPFVYSSTDAASNSRREEIVPMHEGNRNNGLVGFNRQRGAPVFGEGKPSALPGSLERSAPVCGGSTPSAAVGSDLQGGVPICAGSRPSGGGAAGTVTNNRGCNAPLYAEDEPSSVPNINRERSAPVFARDRPSGRVSSNRERSMPVYAEYEPSGVASSNRERRAPVFSRGGPCGTVSINRERSTPVYAEYEPSGAASSNRERRAPVFSRGGPCGAGSSNRERSAPVAAGAISSICEDTYSRGGVTDVVGNNRNQNLLIRARGPQHMAAYQHARSPEGWSPIKNALPLVGGFSAPMVSGYGTTQSTIAMRPDQASSERLPPGPPDLRNYKPLASTTKH